MRRVVITGMGCVTPLGVGVEVFWRNCLAAKNVVEHIPQSWFEYTNYRSCYWAPVPEIDYSKYEISSIDLMTMDPAAIWGVCSALEAFDNAGFVLIPKDDRKRGYTIQEIDPIRCGVFVGIGGIPIHSFVANCVYHMSYQARKELNDNVHADDLDHVLKLLHHDKRFNPFWLSMIMMDGCASQLGVRFSLQGINTTFSSGCASSSQAIGQAFKGISSGQLDIAIAGGCECTNDDRGTLFKSMDVTRTMAYGDDPLTLNRPFDKDRTGFLLSEGGGVMLVLEELEHAKQRNASIIAEVIGYGECFSNSGIMRVDSSGEPMRCVMQLALDDAKISAKDIDYVNAHGTGTESNDRVEAAAIEKIFGDSVLVNATKSLTGHMIGASSAAEVMVSALSISNKTTHICKNLIRPVLPLNFVTEVKQQPITTALSTSFSFGGQCVALVLREYLG